MEETIVVKKKRGRKPKVNKTSEEQHIVEVKPPQDKKKRGRKPKPKPEITEVKIPKKRGRKPLDSNKNIEIVKNNIISEENIILHMPIKTSDIDSINSEKIFMKYNPVLTVPKPFTEDNLFQSSNFNLIQTENYDSNNKQDSNNQDASNASNASNVSNVSNASNVSNVNNMNINLESNSNSINEKSNLINHKEELNFVKPSENTRDKE